MRSIKFMVDTATSVLVNKKPGYCKRIARESMRSIFWR